MPRFVQPIDYLRKALLPQRVCLARLQREHDDGGGAGAARKSAIFIALLTAFAVAAGGAVAKGGHGKAKGKVAQRVFTLSLIPPGTRIAYSKRTRSFFVSITADGAIYRGTLGSDTVSPFISGGAGKAAVGIKVRNAGCASRAARPAR